MMSFSVSLSYPEAPYPAFWGPPTTNTNFCEEDYVVSTYIAEFINTLTNLAYLVYALYGLSKIRSDGQRRWEKALPQVGLFGVGICSTIFHMTLKNYAELTDSSSMALPTGAVMSRLLSFGFQDQERRTLVHVASACGVAMLYFAYIIMNWAMFHFITFAAMILFIGMRTLYLISSQVRDATLRRKLYRTFVTGAVTFVSGFGFWLVDLAACETLIQWKRTLGMPWSFVLELHGLWHILTAIGAYAFIVLVDYLTSEELGGDPGDSLDLVPYSLSVQSSNKISRKMKQ